MAPRDLRETRKLSISCQVVREWTRPVFEGRDPARKAPTQLPAARGSPGVELGAARAGSKMPSEWQGATEEPRFCRSTEPIIVHPILPSLVRGRSCLQMPIQKSHAWNQNAMRIPTEAGQTQDAFPPPAGQSLTLQDGHQRWYPDLAVLSGNSNHTNLWRLGAGESETKNVADAICDAATSRSSAG